MANRAEPDEAPARDGFDMRSLAGERIPPPDWHLETIAQEMACSEPKDRMLGVISRMGDQVVPDFSSLDWDRALARFAPIEYPAYYRQPFHSVPGGYLSEAAAVGDRGAMEAIYQDAHPRRSLGIRDELANLIPDSAKSIVDLGGGTGDAGAAIARRLPGAHVLTIDLSPFMLIAGEHQNGGLPNLEYRQGFAEATGLEAGSADAVIITLVFHECPDTIKASILEEVVRILRPGGTFVLSDTPQDDLHGFRGFYEPYKQEWLDFDPEKALRESGFTQIERQDVAPPLWTYRARCP